MTSASPSEALYRTLRFAMRDNMPEEMARAIFDRAVHCSPERWVVTKISPVAVAALQANDYRKEGIALERAHKRQRNIWQRKMLRWLRDEGLDTFRSRLASRKLQFSFPPTFSRCEFGCRPPEADQTQR